MASTVSLLAEITPSSEKKPGPLTQADWQLADVIPRVLSEAPSHLGSQGRARAQHQEIPAGIRNVFAKNAGSASALVGSDGHLLERLLELVIPPDESTALSTSLIAHFGTFGEIMAADKTKLDRFTEASSSIHQLFSLVRYATASLAHAEIRDRPIINDWDKMFNYLRLTMSHDSVEHFRLLLLDTKNHLISDEVIATGTINHVSVYPREIVKRALEGNAAAVILVHNHPSGCPKPSQDDITTTKDIQIVLRSVEILVHDHVIIGNGKYYSFKENGLIGVGHSVSPSRQTSALRENRLEMGYPPSIIPDASGLQPYLEPENGALR